MSKTKSKKRKRPGQWVDEVVTFIGSFINLETHTGLTREGRLTALEYSEIEINGEVRDVLFALELNGDSFDKIEFSLIRKLSKV